MGKVKFSPIDIESFRLGLKENFPNTFMTMISIIQGVALYFFVDHFRQNHVSWTLLLMSLISFVSIVSVFFYYSWFISVTYRLPDVREALIPFLIGFAESMSISYMGDMRNWWYWSSIFMYVATIAFCNTALGIEITHYDGFPGAHSLIEKEVNKNIFISTAMASLALLVHLLYSFGVIKEYQIDIDACILYLVLTSFLVYTSHRYLQNLFELTNIEATPKESKRVPKKRKSRAFD
ncbi:MAG TPA: hypothetical protein VK914_05760 [bacterium]|jgi:hypothetical protein|nr:hypothetical protein [bacterium]